MNLSYDKYGIRLELTEDIPVTLVLESESVFADFTGNLWNHYNGMESEILVVDGEKELNLARHADVILSPYMINCNDRRLLTRLYQDLTTKSKEVLVQDTAEIVGDIVGYMDKVVALVPYSIDYSLDPDIQGLFKLVDVKFNYREDDLIEQVISYIRLMHQVCGRFLFIFVGLRTYLNEEHMRSLYEDIKYEKIMLLDIENVQKSSIGIEKTFILDRDCCIIEI